MSTGNEATERSSLLGRDLPRPNGVVQDHPIFLRVCHAPWGFINQTTLVVLRGLILIYLTVLAPMLLDYKLYKRQDGDSPWRIAFQFSTIAFILLWLYHLLAFCWSYTHLYYPDIDEEHNTWESVLLRKMSPPEQTITSRNRLYFSLYYTVSHVFAFMNTFIFWAFVVPKGHGELPKERQRGSGDDAGSLEAGDFFSHGWFEPFCVLNLWGYTSLLALFEIMFLNSIKRQIPVHTHIIGLVVLLCAYLGWAAFGKLFIGRAPYFWLDPEVVRYRELMFAYCALFVALGPAFFAFMYGLISLREELAEKYGSPSQDATPDGSQQGDQE
ncbi:hypothetical protein GE21DRAFT_5982 [Neurospora crassa]|uniref:Uncharacterized protein n=2 Tax=Neurospora crassa (strain ATCC 24698 / 74-OR23-1A / CBS 708.71 / DSM 1257 / FGSC 987) TaxID=367110 RepID=V5IMK8_NEUCR|nr:hypothetical protein NCU04520 [Neurospora crassa OR74A]ESA42927.1 hypothetical protein NCU04520 [Neurospora crassa OR74A]KHE79469.1 hypothetical protein GE21DRAFT_5982 [Neurospora crassa]|eukprot:XP_011394110.1 hypothetical protein NCU04520 [Neurospora crassa OR74A]